MEGVFRQNSDVWGMASVLYWMLNPQQCANYCERLLGACLGGVHALHVPACGAAVNYPFHTACHCSPHCIAGPKLGHNMREAMVSQLSTGRVIMTSAMEARGFRPCAEDLHQLVRMGGSAWHVSRTMLEVVLEGALAATTACVDQDGVLCHMLLGQRRLSPLNPPLLLLLAPTAGLVASPPHRFCTCWSVRS